MAVLKLAVDAMKENSSYDSLEVRLTRDAIIRDIKNEISI
jgi:hypothetical protein